MSGRVDTLLRRFVDAREANDAAQKEAKKTKAAFEAVQQEVWEHLDEIGQTTGTFDLGEGYGSIQFQKRETIRGIVKDPEKAAAAITAMGLEDALLGDPKVHQAPLSEHVRDWLASGQPLPEGIDFNPTRYVSMSRK